MIVVKRKNVLFFPPDRVLFAAIKGAVSFSMNSRRQQLGGESRRRAIRTRFTLPMERWSSRRENEHPNPVLRTEFYVARFLEQSNLIRIL